MSIPDNATPGDYAGGLVVHATAGISSLVIVAVLGPRDGFPRDLSPPHNPGMTMMGAGMLWVGWYGFNGGSAYRTSATAFVNTTTDYSIFAWVDAGATGTKQIAVSQSNDNAGFGFGGVNFELGIDAAGKWAYDVYNEPSNSGSTPIAAAVGAAAPTGWTRLTGTVTLSTKLFALYVNGVLAASVTGSGYNPWPSQNCCSQLTVVGHSGDNGAYHSYFTGQIDDVMFYQRTLSAAEIGQIYSDTMGPTLLAGLTGAFSGGSQTGSTAVAYNGTANAYANAGLTNPNPFTVECFVRVGSPEGGAVIGFSATATGRADANHGRQLFVDSAGKLRFSMNSSGTEKTLVSAASVTDGAWHHVAGSLGANGMRLYLDGALVAGDATTTTADSFTGYWRLGGSNLAGFTSRPVSDYLVGTIDEAAVYATQLSDTAIGLQDAARNG